MEQKNNTVFSKSIPSPKIVIKDRLLDIAKINCLIQKKYNTASIRPRKKKGSVKTFIQSKINFVQTQNLCNQSHPPFDPISIIEKIYKLQNTFATPPVTNLKSIQHISNLEHQIAASQELYKRAKTIL